ncbi:hypothetical protein MKZ12_29570 [Paenibacillus sp. FSL R5-0713]|uniref:HD domain-containing protein n=1 Tax=Paenibacillus sp. FSL R5-0713 TaxID=2921655 RepID=UPI0030DB48FD
MTINFPNNIEDLELLKMLKNYADGKSSWKGSELTIIEKESSNLLYSNIINFINNVIIPILNRATSRELESFTMHDKNHGMKVAQLMWRILTPEKREILSPPEIGLLVFSAFFHDLGMALNKEEREKRLRIIWDTMALSTRKKYQKMIEDSAVETKDSTENFIALQKLTSAQEAMLCIDTRERHGSRERYNELITMLQSFHQKDPVNITNIYSVLKYQGDSFLDVLLEICISHNEPAESLLQLNMLTPGRLRFPSNYPVGGCNVNIHIIAAALRLSDILDFDRERTPSVLFHYLLPQTSLNSLNRSYLEWGKHLSISNWTIDAEAITYNGHCYDHVVHHTLNQFCEDISNEIKSTRKTFTERKEDWPFFLSQNVICNIIEHGYKYTPYTFEADTDRVFELFMGKSIYSEPIDALRELIQNAVDACNLRESILKLYDEATKTNPIIIKFEEAVDNEIPKISVIDKGIGMDKWIIENYLFKIGKSYYNSFDFNQTRNELRKKNIDFAPVSEFGIGFLSSFLLSDRVEIETAMWESPRGDSLKRIMEIDGPTRLIKYSEQVNEGPGRYKGTRVTLYLTKDYENMEDTFWNSAKKYLRDVCVDLPYILELQYVSKDGQLSVEYIEPIKKVIDIPESLLKHSLKMEVDDVETGLKGEIVLINPTYLDYEVNEYIEKKGFILSDEESFWNDVTRSEYSEFNESNSRLIRGGFKIGQVPGLPESEIFGINNSFSHISLDWRKSDNMRYPRTDLARNSLAEKGNISDSINRIIITYLINNSENIHIDLLTSIIYRKRTVEGRKYLENYNALKLFNIFINCHAYARDINPVDLLAWKKGEILLPYYKYGNEKRYYENYLFTTILDMLIKYISKPVVSKNTIQLKPPIENWEETLYNLANFQDESDGWGLFAEFEEQYEDVLYIDVLHYEFFNEKYKILLMENFRYDELSLFEKILSKMTLISHDKINRYEYDILERMSKIVGDASIIPFSGSDEITLNQMLQSKK